MKTGNYKYFAPGCRAVLPEEGCESSKDQTLREIVSDSVGDRTWEAGYRKFITSSFGSVISSIA